MLSAENIGLYFKGVNLGHKTVKKTIDSCKKRPVQSIRCSHFPFPCSGKNQDGFSVCSKKQGIYIGKLDA